MLGRLAARLALVALALQAAASGDGAVYDVAEFANMLIVERRFSQAETLLRHALEHPGLPDNRRDSLRYLLGLAVAGREDYPAAAEIFRALLDDKPTATRVRMSLGRVLFLDGNDGAAKRQFDLALADGGAAAAMRRQALAHLRAIRERNGWRFAVDAGISEDSNVNNAPEEGAVVLVGGLPARSPKKRERGWGASFAYSANYRRQLSRRWRLESGLSLRAGGAPGAWDASAGADWHVGARRLIGAGGVGFAFVGGRSWSDGRPAAAIGGRGDVSQLLGERWRARLAAQYLRRDDKANDGADAHVAHLEARADGAISPAVSGGARLFALRSAAERSRYSYYLVGGGAFLRRDFRWGVTGGLSFSVSRLLFDGRTPLVGKRERRRVRNLRLTLLKRDWRWLGFAPELAFSRAETRSNIAISSHDNTVIGLNFVNNF